MAAPDHGRRLPQCPSGPPPVPLWFQGRDRYAAFLGRVFRLRGTAWRTSPIEANGQNGFAAYALSGGEYRLHTAQLLSLREGRVCRNVVYQDPATFAELGIPATI